MHRPLTALALSLACLLGASEESLPPLPPGPPPADLASLWGGYDPTAEPLETEVIKEWEQDGVVLRHVRFRVGIFKGQRSILSAVYGFPKGGKNLPGLLQIHGGGQFGNRNAPLYNAPRGYATLSIAWGGRLDDNPGRVDGKVPSPTDWGALDAYHAPCRNAANSNWQTCKPAAWTIDDRESPRNSNWFVVTLAARRALTFLAQQPEVDRERLGVYGHSMGGKLTVATAAADRRIKAAAPSCGGISDHSDNGTLLGNRQADEASLAAITCPIIFLSPANDFHGRINDLPGAISLVGRNPWRTVIAPHHNHQDNAEAQVAGPLWFDQYLKGSFTYPATPQGTLNLGTADGVPTFTVTPDPAVPNLGVDVYYTQEGVSEGPDDRNNTINRHWHHATAVARDGTWTAALPVGSTQKNLWAYANVTYGLPSAVVGAGYYYGKYSADRYILSSQPRLAAAAGVKATLAPTTVIEDFAPGWDKEWFSYRPETWPRSTHKVHAERWQAPTGARMALEVRADQPNPLVIRLLTARGTYAAATSLNGGEAWQQVAFSAADFKNAKGESLGDWSGLWELHLDAKETLKGDKGGADVVLGGAWTGAPPTFRNLAWTTASAP